MFYRRTCVSGDAWQRFVTKHPQLQVCTKRLLLRAPWIFRLVTNALSESTKGRTVSFFEGEEGWAISKKYTMTAKTAEKEIAREL